MQKLGMDEWVNAATHGFGLLLSLAGGAILFDHSFRHPSHWCSAGCTVYIGSLIGVYAMSTLSHSTVHPGRRQFFRTLDQAFIYLLIVGTYTPFALMYLRTTGWLCFLVLMWVMALAGFFSKILLAHRVDRVAVWLYVILGWMPLVAGIPLTGMVPDAILWSMLAGGICYTLGTVFLVLDKHVSHFHAVWHLFVIAGSVLHYLPILRCVAHPG